MCVLFLVLDFYFAQSKFSWLCICFFFFFNDTATTEIYTLSLHDALPIQATSGKVDRSELQPPPPRSTREDTGSVARLPEKAPRSEKEALLAWAWEDLLRLDEGEVQPEDDFFDLGGHSLAAAQLSSRVEQGFGVHVSMPLFMEDPTPKGLLDKIEALQRDETAGEVTTAEDLTAEAVLDPEITPRFNDGTPTLRDADDIFL